MSSAFIPTGEVREALDRYSDWVGWASAQRCAGFDGILFPYEGYTEDAIKLAKAYVSLMVDSLEWQCKVAFADLQLAYVKDYPHSMLRDEAECFAIKERFLNGERSATWLAEAKELTERMKGGT